MGSGVAGGEAGDRRLIEDAVSALLNEAPGEWEHLHIEFEPFAQSPVVNAAATTTESASVELQVPTEVVAALGQYRARAVTRGESWRRMMIDCHVDGRLSLRTDADEVQRVPSRWPHRVLAAIAVSCSAAAVAVFVVGWRAPSAPPRAGMIEAPAVPPRQQQVFDVMQRWYDAENRGDGAALWPLACAHPGKYVTDEIAGYENNVTEREGIVYLEAVGEFRDDGDRVWARLVSRVHPLSERTTRDVQAAQQTGGFFEDAYTFVSEGGQLKLCDADRPPRQ